MTIFVHTPSMIRQRMREIPHLDLQTFCIHFSNIQHYNEKISPYMKYYYPTITLDGIKKFEISKWHKREQNRKCSCLLTNRDYMAVVEEFITNKHPLRDD